MEEKNPIKNGHRHFSMQEKNPIENGHLHLSNMAATAAILNLVSAQ